MENSVTRRSFLKVPAAAAAVGAPAIVSAQARGDGEHQIDGAIEFLHFRRTHQRAEVHRILRALEIPGF